MTLEEAIKDPFKAFRFGEKCFKENKYGEGIFWMREGLGHSGNDESLKALHDRCYNSLSSASQMQVDLYQLWRFAKERENITYKSFNLSTVL